MQIFKLFTAHPDSVGESYGEHLIRAISFGVRMMLAGVACILHAFLPFLFVRTASRALSELHEQMIAKRSATSVPRALRVGLLKP